MLNYSIDVGLCQTFIYLFFLGAFRPIAHREADGKRKKIERGREHATTNPSKSTSRAGILKLNKINEHVCSDS